MRELVIDNFAGGGGASTGIERALGRPVDVAVNHSAIALAMHARNHPHTVHLVEDVFDVNPRKVVGGRHVAFLWASPDCTQHSRAKGGKPRQKDIRSLATVLHRWASEVRPEVIALENVPEFLDWGPLDEHDRPIPERKGEDFRAWKRVLEAHGYVVEHRVLVAADFGAPTSRKRLFLVARCDGRPIVWPEPTHGPGRAQPWRTAAEVIDWSIPCPSIFDRPRPLAEATLRRIAAGVRRYVLEAARPFIVPVTHPRDARVHSIDEPLRTVTSAHRGELALVVPTIIQTSYGERPGQDPRVPGIEKPLGTIVAGGGKHALVAAFITKHYGGVVGHEATRPLGTVTAVDHHSVTAAFLTKFYGTSTGAPVDEPLPTVTSGGGRGGGHVAEVRALLERFAPAQRELGRADDAVTVTIDGVVYAVSDIGMRMLVPRELFRAQSFPDSYAIDFTRPDGKPATKSDQTFLCGNAVPPVMAEAIARANVGEFARGERAA